MNNNWPQILAALVLVGGPILRKMLQSLAKQREASMAEAARQKRLEDSLRTGQTSEGDIPKPPAGAEVDPLAARRRAQLEELRRRGQQRAASQPADARGAGRAVTGPMVPAPTLPRAPRPVARPQTPVRPAPQVRPPVRPQPRPQARTPAAPPSRPAGSPKPPTRPVSQGARPVARPTQRPAAPAQSRRPGDRTARPSLAPMPEMGELRRLVPEAVPSAAPAKARGGDVAMDLQTAPIADWRRAFIMREILDPPLALRP